MNQNKPKMYFYSLVEFLKRLQHKKLTCNELLNSKGFKRSNLKYYNFAKRNLLIESDHDGRYSNYKLTERGYQFLELVKQ